MAVSTGSFLGANTPQGFVSLFGELYDPYQNHNVHILKGGPGCGKSTLMKKVADRAQSLGFSVERVFCSSDPDSLDAVAVPALRLFFCDGTAPHVVEPRFPGACENLIDLGMFRSEAALHARADLIRKYTLENALFHRRAARYLAAAGALRQASLQLLAPQVLEDKLNGYALRLAMRLLRGKTSGAPGKASRRFLSALTPKGILFFAETVRQQATEILLVEDPFSPAAGMLVSRLASRAAAHGRDHVLMLDPMDPHGDPMGLLVPECAVAVLRKTPQTATLPGARTIHADRFLLPDSVRRHRQRLQFQQKTVDALLQESEEALKQAKRTHDLLEGCYFDATDFDAMNRYCDPLIERIFCEQLSLFG